MEEPSDISYYLGAGAQESFSAIDIVIGSGDIVTIDELPDEPDELFAFLQAEKCAVKYWFLVVQAYSHVGRYSEALEIAQKGLEMDYLPERDKVTIHSALAWIYLAMAGVGPDREACLDNAADHLAKGKAMAGTSMVLAEAQLNLYKDQADVALQLYDKILKEDPSNCLALLGRAQITLSKTQNYTNALKLYQQVLVSNPAIKPDPRIGIGLCFWFLKDKAMALNAWGRALELDSNNFKAELLLNLASFDTVFTNSLSDELFLEGYQKALGELTRLQLDRTQDSVVLLALCSFYYSKGKFDLIEKIVAKIVSSINDSIGQGKSAAKISAFSSKILSSCSFWLGRIAYAKSDFTQAQRNFHEAIRLNENNLLAKLGLGQSQLGRNSIEEATITFESILKTNSKCLEVIYSLGMLYSQGASRSKQEQAIQMLERYIRLSNNRGSVVANKEETDAYLNKEPIALNAYLTLSKLYETRDISQSLTYLHKAVESQQQIGMDAPPEVYNNIAVFNFMKNNVSDALSNLELALGKVDSTNLSEDLKADLKVSMNFNLARVEEATDVNKAIESYNKLLQECPNYFSAKLRLLFLDAVSTNKTDKKELESEIKGLLDEHASNLEIRSFYGWFIKTFGKKLGLKPDADTVHQKETLVEYDSHDCYALISLANIYCVMAKDLKSSKDEEKRKKYFIRALELFTKVLSIDPKNVFAAQGFAIIYIENKEYAQGLDILRKIRDSLNDISVYLNLGHVLTEMKQFSKAVENYEIALIRFANGRDSKILGFLGRAWYLRGLAEKNLAYLKKALEYSEQALKYAAGSKSANIFNVAFIQFQIADFITKQPIESRSVDEINEAIINLNHAIKQLTALASDEEAHAPYPKSELKARANLGTTTLLNRLNTCLDETKENIEQLNNKLEEAKKLRGEEQAKKARELELAIAEQQAKNEALANERARLQEQAQQWAEEARANLLVNESDDDKMFEEENARDKKTGKKKGKGKKGKGKKDFINDSDEDDLSEPNGGASDVSSGNEDEENEAPVARSDKQKKGGKRKRRLVDDEEDDEKVDNEEGNGGEEADAPSNKKKRTFKSEEIVQDSSEDDGENGLF